MVESTLTLTVLYTYAGEWGDGNASRSSEDVEQSAEISMQLVRRRQGEKKEKDQAGPHSLYTKSDGCKAHITHIIASLG